MRKYPSLATLAQVYTDTDDCRIAREFLTNKNFTDAQKLEMLGKLPGCFGVECTIREGDSNPYNPDCVEWINTGDIYNATVIYYNNNFRVSTMGDFLETQEKRGVKFN